MNLSTLLTFLFEFCVCSSAKNTRTGENVAIKKIANAFDHVVDTKRTLREARLLRLMRHENVRVLTVFIHCIVEARSKRLYSLTMSNALSSRLLLSKTSFSQSVSIRLTMSMSYQNSWIQTCIRYCSVKLHAEPLLATPPLSRHRHSTFSSACALPRLYLAAPLLIRASSAMLRERGLCRAAGLSWADRKNRARVA